MHPVIGLVTHGVSGGKIYFFLIYSSVCLFMLFLLNKKKKGYNTNKTLWPERLFFLSVVIGMLSSVSSYLYYAYKYSLSLEAYYYHFKELYNSVNFLPHIHTSKLYLFLISKTFGIENLFANMDDGRVFYGSIPLFFPYLTLFSIISALIISFFIIKEKVFAWNERHRTAISIILIISFSSIIKTISDGGPIAYDFLISTGVMCIIISSNSHEDLIINIKKRWKILFWGYFLAFSTMSVIDPSFGILMYTIKNSLIIASVYSAVYFLTIRDKINIKWRLITLVFFVLFFAHTFYGRYHIYIKPFFIKLEKGIQINYFYYKDRALPEQLKNAKILFNSEFFTIYSFKTEEKIKPLDIYRDLNENPYRNRHIAIVTPKKRQAYGIIAEILFIDFKNKHTSLKLPEIFHLKITKKDSSHEKLNAEIAFDTIYFPALSHVEEGRITQLDENHKFLMYYFINRLFYHSGINEFIFTPVAFYRFN
ncbi:MAG: hypothetical protein N2114_00965 [Candidatus Goldbacteria bacterium]|nr:hypothetical protein [Candidatus Goldiibacteriota bacterium]